MKRTVLIAFLLLLNTFSFAQKQSDKYIIDADKLSEEQFANLEKTVPRNGWILLKYQGENHILNYSNKDYTLFMYLKCANAASHPRFLVEYSNNYGDKEMGGIDFVSSKDKKFPKINFILDGKPFGDPFAKNRNKNFETFSVELKKSKILKIELFDDEMNPETGKNELKLNRTIDFKLANGELLETLVKCD